MQKPEADPATRPQRLIEFLQQLAQLRTKLIREVDQYEALLWLYDIPHEKGCFTVAWGLEDGESTDAWIDIQQRHEPQLADPPSTCSDWVDERELRRSNEEPRLLQTIAKAKPAPVMAGAESDDGESEEFVEQLQLEDHPQVKRAWSDYLEKHWRPWAVRHLKWKAVQSVYAKLYEIHKTQQRLGEEYELAIGLGLLTWICPSGHAVNRHLITARCDLEFEPNRARFQVKPHQNGVQLAVELDMLDVTDQPANAEEEAREKLKQAEDDPWDRTIIDDVLSGLARLLADNGEYHSDLLKQITTATNKPTVSFAPTLILRRRSQRGLRQVLAAMKEHVSAGGDLPPEFAKLCEVAGNCGSDQVPAERSASEPALPENIYFPLPTNSEQEQIVLALRSKQGVLVQGPPGTGNDDREFDLPFISYG